MIILTESYMVMNELSEDLIRRAKHKNFKNLQHVLNSNGLDDNYKYKMFKQAQRRDKKFDYVSHIDKIKSRKKAILDEKRAKEMSEKFQHGMDETRKNMKNFKKNYKFPSPTVIPPNKMTTNEKIMLGGLTAAGIGGAYYIHKKYKKEQDEKIKQAEKERLDAKKKASRRIF